MGEPDDVSMGPGVRVQEPVFPRAEVKEQAGKEGWRQVHSEKGTGPGEEIRACGSWAGGVACGRASGMPKIQVYLHLVEAGNLV